MSPAAECDRAVSALDRAAGAAAATGQALADLSGDADSVSRALGKAWRGRAGARARQGTDGLHEVLRGLATDFLYVCDVLRMEGRTLARALETSGDAGGDAAGIRLADSRLAEKLAVFGQAPQPFAPRARVLVGPVAADPRLVPPTDPRAVPQWWRSLDPGQRQQVVAQRPGLGGLDGLPAVTRDALNRERLDRLLDAGTSPAAHRAVAQYLLGDPRRLLLDIDPDGRAVVADGDPDTARRVVTFVPGTGSGAHAVGDTATRAAAVCDAAEKAAGEGGDACAAVSWFDYQAPPDVARAAVDRGGYTEGAPRLRNFQAGLDAAADALGLTTTDRDVLGYSYGSTVVGAAAADPAGLAANSMLHVGSPGSTVNGLADLRTDVDGVPRPATPEDVIGVRSRWDVVPWWSLSGALGTAPDDQVFGGRAVDVTGPGRPDPVHSHTRYFDPGTVSLAEIGRVLAER